MTAAQDIPSQPAELLMLGRIPPPVTGMTLFTKVILERLQSFGPVEFLNWSVGATRRTAVTRLRYVGRAIGSLLRLLARGRVSGQRLYLVANSEAGLYSTALLTLIAARMGYSVYLHHHVYNYIDCYDRRMARIDRWMGSRGVHVVACQGMMRDFHRQYHTDRRFTVVRPSAVPVVLESPRASRPDPIRLGMLSNLSMAKGLDRTIDTFSALHRAGRRVNLTLAGPVIDPNASELVERAVATNPGLVVYRGPVYAEAKTRFFAEIDVFLFPTQRESWGIVLHEALAAGVPVIANDRGCIALVVGQRAGLVVRRGEDFVESASRQIMRWIDDPDEYLAASQAAIEQADFLNREGQRTLSEFAAHMFSPLGSADGLLKPS